MATLTTPQTTVTANYTVDLPAPTEIITPSAEARAKAPVQIALSQLLIGRDYELEAGDGKKFDVTADASGKASVTHTYTTNTNKTIKLNLVSKLGKRFFRKSKDLVLLEEQTLQIPKFNLNFRTIGGNIKKTVTPFGQNTLSPLDLKIQFSGFGELEGNFQFDNGTSKITPLPFKLKLEKTTGKAIAGGLREIVYTVPNLPVSVLGTRDIKLVITKANDLKTSGESNSVSYFVHPTAFYLGGTKFVVKTASGSLDNFTGNADFELVIDSKLFGNLNIDFSALKTKSRATDLNPPAIISEVNIESGVINSALKAPLEIQTSDRIGLTLRALRFETTGAFISGGVAVPYPTCKIEPLVQKTPKAPENRKPDLFDGITRGVPFPNELVNPILNSNQQLNAAQQLGAVQNTAFTLNGLGAQGALNFAVDVPNANNIRGSRAGASRVARASLQLNQPIQPATNVSVTKSETTPVVYEILGNFSDAKLTGDVGNLYIENVVGNISGRLPGIDTLTDSIKITSTAITTTSAPPFDANDGAFSIGCSGAMLPANPTMTIDLSNSQSPPPDALLETYAGTLETKDTSATWRGVLFPKASTTIRMLEGTQSYQKAEDKLGGVQIKDPFQVNVTYEYGYNWAVTKNNVGSGVVNAWKFDIANFGMAMYHSRIVSGGGAGKFYLPFFELFPNGRFFVIEVKVGYSPTWEIVTDDFIQRDFGSSSVIGGCGVFIKAGGSYPIQFANAYWAVKGLMKNPEPINSKKPTTSRESYKVINSTPFETFEGQTKIVSAGIFGDKPSQYSVSNSNMGNYYDAALTQADPTIDKTSRCNPDTPLESSSVSKAGLRIPLPNLRIHPDSKVDIGGNAWSNISGTDNLEIAGMQFPANQVGIGRDATGKHYLALKTDRYNAIEKLPAVKAELQYPVSGGRSEGIVILKGFSVTGDNLSEKMQFTQDFADRTIALAGREYNLEKTGFLEQFNKKGYEESFAISSGGYLAAASGDFEISSQNGKESRKIKIGDMAAVANMTFGRKAGKFYFSVFAGVEKETPIVTVLGVFNLYGFYGGVNYNRRWNPGATYKNFKTDFTKESLEDFDGLQVIAGVVVAVETGSSYHAAGTLLLDIGPGGGAITLNVTGWLLTPMKQGYFGKDKGPDQAKKPQSKALISISSAGFIARLCIGDSPPPGSGMDCKALVPLEIARVVITGWAELKIGQGQYHLYVGNYTSRVKARFFDLIEATGYFMAGQMDAGSGNPPGVQDGAIGLWLGGDVKAEIKVGDKGTVDLLFDTCNWYWYAEAKYYAFVDFGLQIDPRVELNAAFGVDILFKVGAGACGIGIDISINLKYGGSIKANSDGAQIKGYVSVRIEMPIIPDIELEAKAEVNL
jgi:hypothetical protein